MKKVCSVILVFILLIGLTSCGKTYDIALNIEDIHAVCELATLKCYYNNVAEIQKEKDNIFQKDRKMWIEHEGEVVLGIDMSKLKIEIENETVTITLPQAEILSIKPVEKTLNEQSYIVSSDGWLFKNKKTTEDQEEGVKKGQTEMENATRNNHNLLQSAQDNAKKFIENYINKIAELSNIEYKIKWKSAN